MSRNRRRGRSRNKNSNSNNGQQNKQSGNKPQNQQQGGNKQGGKKRQNRKKNNRRRGRRSQQEKRFTGQAFWGDADRLPDDDHTIRITTDPGAVARSLGPPPLRAHENVAGHYFAAVYDNAVRTAGLVAAAGGLIDAATLTDDDED